MATTEKICCKNCMFGEVSKGLLSTTVICKCYPPTFSGSGGFQRQPEMRTDDWCGEMKFKCDE